MQTTNNLAFTRKIEGMVADHRYPTEIISCVAGEELQAGDLVYASSYTEATVTASKPTADNTVLFGIVVLEHRETGRFAEKATVPVMRKGAIWVARFTGTIVAGQHVVVKSAGGRLAQGSPASKDTSMYGTEVLSAPSGGLFKLLLNLPAYHVTAS